MATHPLAGKPAPREILVNVPRLVSAYYTQKPDPSIPEQQVAFGTSGHRGSSLQASFNEDHILAICQAICRSMFGQIITRRRILLARGMHVRTRSSTGSFRPMT